MPPPVKGSIELNEKCLCGATFNGTADGGPMLAALRNRHSEWKNQHKVCVSRGVEVKIDITDSELAKWTQRIADDQTLSWVLVDKIGQLLTPKIIEEVNKVLDTRVGSLPVVRDPSMLQTTYALDPGLTLTYDHRYVLNSVGVQKKEPDGTRVRTVYVVDVYDKGLVEKPTATSVMSNLAKEAAARGQYSEHTVPPTGESITEKLKQLNEQIRDNPALEKALGANADRITKIFEDLMEDPE